MLSINIPFAPWSSGKYAGRVEENELALKTTERSIADMRNMVLAEVRDLAVEAVQEKVAKPMGMSVEEAAWAIKRVVDAHMGNEIFKETTVAREIEAKPGAAALAPFGMIPLSANGPEPQLPGFSPAALTLFAFHPVIGVFPEI